MIVGNMIGGNPLTPKTYIFKTEDGQEIPGVLVSSEMILTATANDIRKDSVAVTDAGVTTGTKVIPAYHTCQGTRLVTAGSSLTIPNVKPDIDIYDYTKLQSIVCAFNTSLENSVSAEKVAIDDKLYNVQSTESISTIIKNHDSKTIELGFTNESSSSMVIRFFMYKEIE